MLKKLIVCCFAAMLACVNMGVSAQEVSEEPLDYTEEIEMFNDFYQNPENYIFQDVNGEEINSYVWEYKEAFYKNQYATTDELMETVRSVQEADQSFELYAAKTKTWSNLKVYFEKNLYCVYSVSATYNVVSNKITSGKATPKVVEKNGILRVYAIDSATGKVSNAGKKITFSLKHYMDTRIVTTTHSITI